VSRTVINIIRNEEYVLYLLNLAPKCKNIYNSLSNKQETLR